MSKLSTKIKAEPMRLGADAEFVRSLGYAAVAHTRQSGTVTSRSAMVVLSVTVFARRVRFPASCEASALTIRSVASALRFVRVHENTWERLYETDTDNR
jgi:hypothetical protein